MAAVLACGADAVLSHRSAAALWGLRSPGATAIDVTVPLGGPRGPSADLRLHRSSLAKSRFGTVERGIPVTTVAWTLLDLASVIARHRLRRAVEQADRLTLLDVRAVERAMAASPRRPGSPALRAVLEDMGIHGITHTRSDVEAAFLQACVDRGLPRPRVNMVVDGVEADFRWPRHRLIVEVDGWAYHRGRAAFSADRARDRGALAAGWRVARFTASDVLQMPHAVAAEVERLLAR